MANKILISAETGSDITEDLAREYGIILIPMHVTLGDKTLDDGAFPPEDVCAYYDKTGKCPEVHPTILKRYMTAYLLRIPICRSTISSDGAYSSPRW